MVWNDQLITQLTKRESGFMGMAAWRVGWRHDHTKELVAI